MRVLLAGCLLIACGPAAGAEDVKNEPAAPFPDPVIAANCDLTQYKSVGQVFGTAVTIPDVNLAGITLGPVQMADDGQFIDAVVLELDMRHPYVGDLIVRLRYDENDDGTIDATSTVLCRPGRATCTGGSGFGCDDNFVLGASYRFDDTAAGTLPEACTNADIPGGCYRPAGATSSAFTVFRGRGKGGAWTLFVSDNATGGTGAVQSWAVHILNTPVATLPTTWGSLKLRYR